MSRPKGSKNKTESVPVVKEAIKEEISPVSTESTGGVEVVPAIEPEKKSIQDLIKERKAGQVHEVPEKIDAKDLPPLDKGLSYFESPDGRFLIGESNKDHLWDRKANNGKGGWINKRR